ncbi:MAG: acetylxylan esterase [Bacteroidales bacterium]|nr:acetylxylan esterase [Bacteroidales bacterium]
MFRTIFTLLLITFFLSGMHAQNLPVQTQPDPDQSNNIRNYLMQAAEEISDNVLSGIHSLEDWEKIRPQRYNEFIEMISLEDMPLNGKRTELNVRITGTVQKEGYRIEKLYYESLPGLYVPANLYIPDKIKKPRAAILYVCGHSPTQKVRYQPHPRKFAQLGFVCLIIETIQMGEVRGEHWGCYANGWFHWYSRGYTPAGVEAWNAIRGLDLLSERPEVDPEKLGVTGLSGGGSQSWYIAAADPRIKAAAPVCGASTLKAHLLTRTIDGHCDCMMPINTYRRDFQDIGALIAPRPLLIAQADLDGLNTIESVRELYSDIKKIYDLYDAPEHISLVETPGGHSYHQISRQKIFSFFLKHLMGKQISPEDAGDIDESPEIQLSEEELKVYVDGVPENDRTTKIQDSFVKLPAAPVISNEKELYAFRDSVKRFLKRETFGAFPQDPVPFDPRLVFRAADGAQYGWEVFSFISEEGWRLKVDVRWKNEPHKKKPLMIVLRSPDEDRWESEGFIGGLNNEWNIAYFEVRGVGENGWASNLQWHVRRASAWTGRTVASMQVYDLLRCLQFCRTLEGVDAGKIGIAARNEMAVVAMYTALLDGNCQILIVNNPPESQDIPSRPDGRGAAIEMLNCLRVTDVYQLPALLSPARIVFIGEIPVAYQWSEKILKKLGKSEFSRFDSVE